MVNVHEPIDDKLAEMHIMATCWFLWFWLRACGTHTPNFLTLPIEWKCWTMMEWSQFITFASSQVQWLGSLRIIVFKRSSSNPKGFPEYRVSLMSKWSFLNQENHFLAMLSLMALSPYTAQMFLDASAAFATLLNSERKICWKCSNFSTWHSIF